MATPQKSYQRFTLSQRIEHWVMTISFIVLIATGLPQRYALSFWAEPMINLFGGIESTRIIHRVAAVVFMLISLYHIVAIAYRIYVKRVRLTMLPSIQDAFDMVNSVRYYLGLTREHPKLPRYNYAEKMEYWAVVWGGVLMSLTGFMLWNPVATTRFLPGEFVPAAKAAHSAEALLAFLAIVIWHFYFVHLKIFNKSMFTGKISRELMEEEHGAELEEIEAGIASSPPVPPDLKRKRQRIFVPVASVILVVGVASLYYFVTLETTAITTVPPAEMAQAFVPATPTPVPTAFPSPTPRPSPTVPPGQLAAVVVGASQVSVPVVSHSLEGRDDCLQCHALDSFSPSPQSHANWPNSTCLACHAPAGAEAPQTSPVIPHGIRGQEECFLCHQMDSLPENHQEAQFTNAECLFCHELQEGILEQELEEVAAPEAGEGVAAAAPPITHAIEGRETCLQCHALDAMSPVPDNHENWPESTCLGCHAPEGETPTLISPAITHPVEGREECTLCHQLDGLPENHQEAQFTNAECLYCHSPQAEEMAEAEAETEEAEEPADVTTEEPEEPAEVAAEEEEEPAEAEEEGVAAAPPITHDIEGRETCLQCHALDAMSPVPDNHENWPESTCLGCHAPEGETPTLASPAITHPVEGREECTLCHQLDGLPENHQEAQFTNAECLYCHSPQTEEAEAMAEPEEIEEMAEPEEIEEPADTAAEEPEEPAEVAAAEEEAEPAEAEEAEQPEEAEAPAAGAVSFSEEIQPLLDAHCADCHNAEMPMGDLDVASFDALSQVLEPGSPDDSLIVDVMQGRHPYRLVGDNLQLLIDWIAAGAVVDDAGEAAQTGPADDEEADEAEPEETEEPADMAAEEPEEPAEAEEEGVAAAPPITHAIEGRENCLQCHALDAMSPVPDNHENWPESTCLGCHAPEGETPTLASPAITHPVEGREECTLCHQLDGLPENHQEAQFTNAECLYCHSPQAEEAGDEEAEQMAEPEETEEPADTAAEEEPEEAATEEAEEPEEAEAPAAGAVSFSEEIQPLLDAHCADCHNAEMPMGDLDVASFDSLGQVLEPGSPDDSLIVDVMQGRHPYRLVGDNLQLLIDWIAAGAADN